MQEFKVRLIDKRQEVKGTKTFFFEKPTGFHYVAGQYAYFTLPELKFPDPRGKIRHFTLSSSPTENHLSITVRLREESGYKQTLDQLLKETEVDLRGPTGDFVLDELETRTQIMIAGGIGITPYRSIIKYVSDKAQNVPIHLIYSNSFPEEIIFKDELDSITKEHKNIRTAYTITKPKESNNPWDGLTGRIDENMLAQLTSQYPKPVYWLCGPPVMVQSLEKAIDKLAIPQESIKIEKFTGY